MSSSDQAWAIPKGSTVLVTGANGYLASHIADQFLQHGFKVRGTVRNASRHAWLTDLFSRKYGEGSFELCEVADLSAEGAFNEPIKGVSAVAHVASTTSLDYDPNKVIPTMVSFALNALKAAYAEPGVKRFVFCSSSWAVESPSTNTVHRVITEKTYNDAAVKAAWAPPPYTPERAVVIYTASKVESEQAVWKYHNDHRAQRPDLVVNTVLPSLTAGNSLDPFNQGFPSTAGMISSLRKGELNGFHHGALRQYFIDVQDVGRLHVAAAIFEKVQDRRLFGYAERVCWDTILDILRRLEPDREFIANFSGGEDPSTIEPRETSEALLRDMGQPGFISLEQSVKELLQGLKEVEAKEASA